MRRFSDCGEHHLVMTSSLLEAGCAKTEYLLAFAEDMRDFDLDFVDAHAPWGGWSDPAMPLDEWKEVLLMRHRMCFRFCRYFGIRTVTFHTGNPRSDIYKRKFTFEDYCRSMIRTLEQLLPEAEKCGIIIALENQWTPLNRIETLLQTIEHFRSPNLGLCFDSGHANVIEKGMDFPNQAGAPKYWSDVDMPVQWETKVVERMAPHVVNCHLHDNNCGDEHLLPGLGSVDWQRVKTALRGAPRLLCLQNECKAKYYTIEEICRTFQELLRDF